MGTYWDQGLLSGLLSASLNQYFKNKVWQESNPGRVALEFEQTGVVRLLGSIMANPVTTSLSQPPATFAAGLGAGVTHGLVQLSHQPHPCSQLAKEPQGCLQRGWKWLYDGWPSCLSTQPC